MSRRENGGQKFLRFLIGTRLRCSFSFTSLTSRTRSKVPWASA
jgi:hypothetical protein